jgi:hypothetical protein
MYLPRISGDMSTEVDYGHQAPPTLCVPWILGINKLFQSGDVHLQPVTQWSGDLRVAAELVRGS